MKRGVSPVPFIAIWGRGQGKTTNAEVAAVRVGAKKVRRFVLYVRSTQDKANETVSNIAGLLEKNIVEQYHPELGQRLVGKYGNSKGWRLSQLRTQGGFSVVGLGLDASVRGVKIEENRPDLIIFDDVDSREDSQAIIDKKVRTITETIIPAGSPDVAVLFVQNLIHANSIASQLVDRTATGADFLSDRFVSGPHPAIKDMIYEAQQQEDGTIRHIITGGTATWAGQSLEVCQQQINKSGIRSFLQESQHEVTKDKDGALWSRDLLDTTRAATAPNLFRIITGVDPQASTGQTGIIAAGIARVRGKIHGFVIADRTPKRGVNPGEWGLAVVASHSTNNGDLVVGEVNNGGDMIGHTIKTVEGGRNVPYKAIRASRGKYTRAEPIAALFTEGRCHLVGYFPELEDELCGWVPGEESPNRLDAMVWALTELMLGQQTTVVQYA